MVSQWKTPRVLQMQLVSKTSEFVHSGQVWGTNFLESWRCFVTLVNNLRIIYKIEEICNPGNRITVSYSTHLGCLNFGHKRFINFIRDWKHAYQLDTNENKNKPLQAAS
jgi:hypothetical protein